MKPLYNWQYFISLSFLIKYNKIISALQKSLYFFLLWFRELCKFRALFVLTTLSQRWHWYIKVSGKCILSTWFIMLFFWLFVFPHREHWKPTESCKIYFTRLFLSLLPEIDLIKTIGPPQWFWEFQTSQLYSQYENVSLLNGIRVLLFVQMLPWSVQP